MKGTAETVIIGGGIMGASIAWHLASRGMRDIVVLERSAMFGLGSTGLNAGGVRHQFSTAVNIGLSRLSFEKMERFGDEMGHDVSLRRCGYLFLLDNDRDLEQYRANVALQNAHGVPSRLLSRDEIAALAPEVNLHGIVAGSWCALDGLVDPHGLLQGYISRARELGVTLSTSCPAVGIETKTGRVTSVVTPQGAIDTRHVVIAAGPWSAQVGALAGIDIPIEPIRRQIAVTRPAVALRSEFPFVIDFSRSLYFHREGAGILTGMSNRDERPGFDTRVDEEWQLQHLEQAMLRLPLLEEAELVTQWAGLYEVTPDDQPIMGRLPEVENLFICAGFSGHGLMHGPAAGLLMAEEIIDGRPHTLDIDTLRWTRFTTGALSGEYNVV